MEFGKSADSPGMDLRLPADAPGNARILPGNPFGSPRIYAGCPVWQDDALARKVCPPGTPKAKRLAAYARAFDTTELNSTGYGFDPGRARAWAAAVPAGFRFCPKFTRDVTLAPNLDAVHAIFTRQCGDFAAFDDRLGAVLLQFPEALGPSRFPELANLLAIARPSFPLAVEVRHPAWFRNPAWTDRLAGLLEENKAAMVITDAPGRRDVIHMRLTAPWAFIRVNGHDGGESDHRRLDDWAERIAAWMGKGLREAYFFPHFDPVDGTADLAVHFLRSLKARTGLDIRIPRLFTDEEEPRLAL
ncbi:MAG: DUF72 domain-containing protein [Fibrobacteres bacterium]|nr:DUF72 domain-containing protein [Fibrobacterota bacterium]